MTGKYFFIDLREKIAKEKEIIKDIISFSENPQRDVDGRRMIYLHINSLKEHLTYINSDIQEIINKLSLIRPLNQVQKLNNSVKDPVKTEKTPLQKKAKKLSISSLEKETLKRIKKEKKKTVEKKLKGPSKYLNLSSKFFFKWSSSLSEKEFFEPLKKDLIKTNLQFVLTTYISMLIFTTLLSVIAGIAVFFFFLFFNVGANFPIVTKISESVSERFLKVFWILFAVPIVTFLFGYFYPSMERRSMSQKIDQELPFATIHMSAISGSLVDPSKIFEIIISTKEYPHLEREFTKLMNEINIYGYDLVSALRSVASKSPSDKLFELFNGLATTITSGGDLSNFFDKRARSLLFDYRLEREKYTKTAETFMDIYISVVIAAPMILMLLLVMIKVSGLGLSISTSLITLIMILGVSTMNVIFLTFLHLKQPSG